MAFLVALVIIVVGVVGYGIVLYNTLVGLKNAVDAAWSNVDVQLQRRYDLVPNLVSTVKGYAQHESNTLEAVISARNMASAAAKSGDIKNTIAQDNFLSSTLKSLFALTESYPDLKANTNFLELQKELTNIEGAINTARNVYNTSVQVNNTKVEQFPNNLIAVAFSFRRRDFFEIDEVNYAEIVKAPKVEF